MWCAKKYCARLVVQSDYHVSHVAPEASFAYHANDHKTNYMNLYPNG